LGFETRKDLLFVDPQDVVDELGCKTVQLCDRSALDSKWFAAAVQMRERQ
jgi:hypothetical protein